MVHEKKAKTIALIFTAIVMILCLFDIPTSVTGIYPGCPFTSRLTYHFFHAGLLHAAVNCWCILSVAFIYEISAWRLLATFMAASSFPVDTLSFLNPCSIPTVGASGICYALLGGLSFTVTRKAYFQAWMAVFIAVGFLFNGTNPWLHLYCYICGIVIGFLNKPVR